MVIIQMGTEGAKYSTPKMNTSSPETETQNES